MATGGTDGAIAFVWRQFGAYHMDRCEGVGAALGAERRVIGIEMATQSDTYAWGASGDGVHFTKVTLFAGANVDRLSGWLIFVGLLRRIRADDVDHLFLAGYEQPALFAIAAISRLLGTKVYIALDSKFDDKPRRMRTEWFKQILMLPYHGAFAAGTTTRDYLRFLGFRRRPIALGYDTVSLARLRALVPDVPVAWGARSFLVVARFVLKKNLAIALHAFAAYRAATRGPVRKLRLCGSGPQEAELRALAETLGIAGDVDFIGFADQAAVALELSRALCLLLPSVEEQWGLVVNEALAFALPLVVSENVGARDLLVRSMENGFVLSPHDPAGWAHAMTILAEDRTCWERMHAASRARAHLGDVATFVAGVQVLIAPPPESCAAS
jgi:glycosyltransferase involved in cell wall biosynthesis